MSESEKKIFQAQIQLLSNNLIGAMLETARLGAIIEDQALRISALEKQIVSNSDEIIGVEE